MFLLWKGRLDYLAPTLDKIRIPMYSIFIYLRQSQILGTAAVSQWRRKVCPRECGCHSLGQNNELVSGDIMTMLFAC